MVCTANLFLSHLERSFNFELVHVFLINWVVSLGTHVLHCLLSLVMENSFSRQFFEGIQLFLDNKMADDVV